MPNVSPTHSSALKSAVSQIVSPDDTDEQKARKIYASGHEAG
jgi:hypothetical protein